MATYLQIPISGGVNGPIRIEHIYTVLDEPIQSNGYELNHICTNAHGKTNMWARYKPEAIGGPAPLTEAQRKANNYGLVPSDNMRGYKPSMDATNGIPALSEVTWRYVAPYGPTHYMRITDWAGYEVQASGPVAAFGDVELEMDKSSVTILMSRPKISTVNSLTMADFGYCKDMYFCIAIWTVNKSTGQKIFYNYRTANSKISDTLATDNTSVTFTRSELSGFVNVEIHYTACFSTVKSTDFSGGIITTTLYPLVTNTPPTGEIIISTSAPFKFVLEGVANLVTDGYWADSLERYTLSTVTPNGQQQITALGVGGNSGTMVFFGYFEASTGTSIPYPAAPIECTMTPTITGTSARQKPFIYRKNSDSSYTKLTTSLTLTANQKVYVALEFPQIAYIPKDNDAAVMPDNSTYDKYTPAFVSCKYQASGASTTTTVLFSRQFNIWQGYDDKWFIVNQLAT